MVRGPGSGVKAILPGSTLGILGGGQLGRMIAAPARQLGYGVVVLAPEGDAPALGMADLGIRASFDDLDAARRLAQLSDLVTYEFENVPAATAAVVQDAGKLRPNAELLRLAQDRNIEHNFLERLGVSTAPGRAVHTVEGFDTALAELGSPSRLKSALGGYDGGGQLRVVDAASAAEARLRVPDVPGGWRFEGEVNFEREISVVLARDEAGRIEAFPPFENVHREGILRISTWPAAGSPRAIQRALEVARAIAEAAGLIGVMCVEFFVVNDDVLVNELAPRVHNSGHLTVEGASISQFELHLRAICGLPLLKPVPRAPGVAMVNLLGTEERRHVRLYGADSALGESEVSIHLYGKDRERVRRKMGHVTALGANAGDARERALRAAAGLRFATA